MARRFPAVLLLLASLILCGLSAAQPAQSQPRPAQPDSAAPVIIGQSVFPLNGPWKFRVGDSPIDPATHKPLWADPTFDDSEWETVDLTPKSGSFDPVIGSPGYVPGWSKKGHPGYWGYAWYRIRIRLSAQPGNKLAISGSDTVDDGYQLFANGVLLGSFGDFSASRPVTYFTRPMMFSLPQARTVSAGQGPTSMVLAFRFWMDPNTLSNDPNAGGFHTAPMLGDAGTVAAKYQIGWFELIRAYAPEPIEGALFLLLAVVSFSLTLFDRSDRVYLWIGAIFLLSASENAVAVIATWTQSIGGIAANFWQSVIQNPLVHVGWVMVWWFWFRLQRPAWLPRAVAALTLVYMGSNLLGGGFVSTAASYSTGTAFQAVSLAVRLIFLALSLWIVVQGIRQQGLDGWLVLPAVILIGISWFSVDLRFLHIWLIWFPFGLRVRLRDIADLLLVTALALLLLRRLLMSVRRQRQMALDVKQAQEVQQVILPEARIELPGFIVESEYRPAREVGGDFFQIVLHKTEGSLLVVAGDVTGKGLQAGMLVALLVGAIRSTTELNSDPEFVLQALNRRLMGRSNAHATCLALRIDADGSATLANAGHMPPYLNGQPVEIEGSLPLGMMEEADFSIMQFQLQEGDRIMLMSDGIAEATDAEGHLFGFERVLELLRTAKSAAEVALAAQSFGQEDDISVISVTRTKELVPAMI